MNHRMTAHRPRRWTARLAAVACVGVFVASACGGDDDAADEPASDGTTGVTDAATTDTTAATGNTSGASTPTGDTSTGDTVSGGGAGGAGTVDGCGPDSVTDLSDISPDRPVARCEPDAPAPVSLDVKTKLTVSTAFNAEFTAPLLLANELGEFEKENLEVEVVNLDFATALQQMSAGRIDAAIGGAEAGWYNAYNQGIEAKWIMGNYIPTDADDTSVAQTGLWVRKDAFSDPENPDLAELAGKKVASAVGLGSVITYPIAEAFAEAGVSLQEMDVQELPSTDMITALENEAVDAAWLLDPYWIDAANNDDLMLAATQPPGETLGGLFASPRLYQEEPQVGEAFVRAMIRTVNTYLDGDYQSDTEIMETLSKVTETPVESLAETKALLFDWEIRDRSVEETQKYFIEFGVVEYDQPIPAADLIDRSLYLAAIGQGDE